MQDEFNLERFVEAQAPVIDQVRRELAEGRKRTHWMWYVFPQIRGLGHSQTAQFYAITSLAEAIAYLRHPVLGPRLHDCAGLVNKVQGQSAQHIFGSPDDLKFHSSMTLFAQADLSDPLFKEALDKFFAGCPDSRTLELCSSQR